LNAAHTFDAGKGQLPDDDTGPAFADTTKDRKVLQNTNYQAESQRKSDLSQNHNFNRCIFALVVVCRVCVSYTIPETEKRAQLPDGCFEHSAAFSKEAQLK